MAGQVTERNKGESDLRTLPYADDGLFSESVEAMLASTTPTPVVNLC